MPPCGALNAKHSLTSGNPLNAPKSAGYPRLRLDEVSGWLSLPEVVGADGVPRIGDQGEDFNPATSVGKTITYSGRLQAGYGQTREQLELYASNLIAGWSNRNEQTFLVEPWWSSEQYVYHGRILTFDGDDKQERGPDAVPSPWEFAVTANVRMKDGRFFHWNESGVPGQFMTQTAPASVVVDNTGNAPADPIITVAGVGAGQDVHLIRVVPGGTDLDLWFRGLDAGTLIVDFSVRRAYINDLLTDVSESYDELSSTWWDEWQVGLPPGTWTINKGPGTGTSIKVDWLSAWI